MAHVRVQKTSFAGGEIAPELLGRGDLRAFENGASRLRNVFLHPTGGVARRAGLRFVDMASGDGRLVAFEFNTEQVYLLAFSDARVDVYRDDHRVATFDTPWTADQLGQIQWTQSADTLLVVHPDVSPRKITRASDDTWLLAEWSFATKSGRKFSPHHKFVGSEVTLKASGTTGTVQITASTPVFVAGHAATRLRIDGKEVEVTQVASPTVVQVNVKESLKSTAASEDWTEEAFSSARGWPVSVCFHQDRLVVGGSRDLPNRLWLSKSADLFNFDLGEGLDDESIEFAILSDQVNAVRHVFSGRHLQVFTSGAEWMVTGDPLTPTSIQLFRQTRVGSRTDRSIPPLDVDGATLFVPHSGAQLRQFVYTDTEQAYQSADLALMVHHLIEQPVDMCYDAALRLLHLVMANGTMATLTVYRDEEVSGWTLQSTSGRFLAASTVGDSTYVLVERDAGIFIELFDATLRVDCGLSGNSATPRTEWSGVDHLEGQTVKCLANGAVVDDLVVAGGSVTLSQPASTVQLGLGFSHVIEPLPPASAGQAGGPGAKLRPISLTLRVLETSALYLDRGQGLAFVPFRRFGDGILDSPPPPFSGDVTIRLLGWRDAGTTPLWRIEQDTPLPFTLLSVTTELSVNS